MDSSDSEPTTTKKIFKCTVPNCHASFLKNRKLISHIRIHTGERPFACNEVGCNKTYTNSSHLIRHKNISHGEKHAQTVVCDFEGCGLVLANKYSLKKHYNRKHNPELYPFKCNECSQGFHRKKQLQKHSYLHTGEAPFSCDKCDMSFTTCSLLNKHKRSHRDYKCDCGGVFYRWSLLLSHKKTCNKTNFICNICHKTFSHAGNLNSHKLVHLNQKDSEKVIFTCPYIECKRSYFYKRNLNYHMDNFHKNNRSQTFKCTYPKCLVVLKTKQGLKMHLQRHFTWVMKKKRQERRDKNKPKKTMVSVLLEKGHHQIENENDHVTTIEGLVNNTQTSDSEQITNDDLLKECDVTLQLINEKLIAAV